MIDPDKIAAELASSVAPRFLQAARQRELKASFAAKWLASLMNAAEPLASLLFRATSSRLPVVELTLNQRVGGSSPPRPTNVVMGLAGTS